MVAALSRKQFIGAGCVLVLLVALRIALDPLAGVITREVFARGTGCDVKLADSSVSIFPLGAETHNVSIVCPDEGPEGGFHAETVRVALAFLPLFKKQVVLKELVLEQSRVDSRGEFTGFIQTLNFLFADGDQPKADLPSWLKPIAGGWKVWTREILITTPEAATEALRIGVNEAILTADTVVFKGHDPTGEPIQPVEVTVEATGVSVVAEEGEELRRRPLGLLYAKGGLGAGRARFDEVLVTPPDKAGGELRAHGNLFLKDEDRYEIFWSANLADEYLHAVALGDREVSEKLQGQGTFEGTLTGLLTAPVLDSQINLRLKSLPYFSLREGCLPHDISAEVRLTPEALSLLSLRLDDVLEQGKAVLRLDEQTFSGEAVFALNQEKKFLERCLSSDTVSEHSIGNARVRSLHDAIADSKGEVEFSGALNPPALKAEVRSDFYLRDTASRSKLKLNLNYAADVLAVELKEQGVVPQIQEVAPVDATEAMQTGFYTAINSNIDAGLTYDLSRGVLDIERLEVTRYPTRRIAARLAPFLPEDTYHDLAGVLTRESLTDLTAKLSVNPLTAEANGNLELNISRPAEIFPRFSSLNLSLSADGAEYVLNRATLKTPDGELSAQGRYVGAKEISGSIKAEQFLLGQLALGQTVTWLNGALLNGALSVSGPPTEARYDGDLKLLLPVLSGTVIGEQIEINVAGDLKNLRLLASASEERGEISLTLPFSLEKELLLDARLRQFPLSFLSQPPSRLSAAREATLARLEGETSEAIRDSHLSGEITYRGRLADPLLGKGTLHIEELLLRGDGFNVRHGAPLRASLANGRLVFDEVILDIQRRPLIIGGYVDRSEGWNAQVQGNVRLGRYLSRFRELEQASGVVLLDLLVEGPWNAPSLRGPLTLTSGSISLPVANTIVGLEDIEARAELNGGRLQLESAEGRIGGGVVTARGSVSELFEARARETALELSFENIVVEPFPHTVVQFGGPLLITQAPGEPLLLQGTMVIDAALYENTIDYTEILEAVTRSLLRGRASVAGVQTRSSSDEQGAEAVSLDLRIRAENGLLIDTNFAEIEMGADVRLFGSAASPRLQGKLEAIEGGTFGPNNAVFELLAGSLRFSGEDKTPDPELQLIGETPVRTITGEEQLVRLVVSGNLSNPQVHFSSDGGLSEQEIIGLITGGSGIGGLSIIARKERDYTFRELISPASNLNIGDRFAGLTGFSEVEIKTELSRVTGEFVPLVAATQSLTSDLNLDVKTELGGERLSELNLIYPLTPYLNLVGGWKSRPVTTDVNEGSGSYEAGVRYRRTFSGLIFWRPSAEKKRPQ